MPVIDSNFLRDLVRRDLVACIPSSRHASPRDRFASGHASETEASNQLELKTRFFGANLATYVTAKQVVYKKKSCVNFNGINKQTMV